MEPQPSIQSEREALIAQLEADNARRPSGAFVPIAAVALLATLALGFWMKSDTAYYFSSREPLELGAEGDYHVERALSNRYAQIHGVPSARGWYTEEADGSFVVVGINDTPVLLRRATFDEENRRLLDGKRAQPRQNPFFARGRLFSRADASQYEEVFREYETWSGSAAQWILLAERAPGQDFAAVAMFGVVIFFAAVNAWLVVRGLALRR